MLLCSAGAAVISTASRVWSIVWRKVECGNELRRVRAGWSTCSHSCEKQESSSFAHPSRLPKTHGTVHFIQCDLPEIKRTLRLTQRVIPLRKRTPHQVKRTLR